MLPLPCLLNHFTLNDSLGVWSIAHRTWQSVDSGKAPSRLYATTVLCFLICLENQWQSGMTLKGGHDFSHLTLKIWIQRISAASVAWLEIRTRTTWCSSLTAGYKEERKRRGTLSWKIASPTSMMWWRK